MYKMANITIDSKRHGKMKCLISDEDISLVNQFGNGNGKWCVSVRRGKPYAQKRIEKIKLVELHRLIMGFPTGKYVDHINGNTLDNRRENLRICTNSANLRNASVRQDNKSGYKGVYYDTSRDKWMAYIKVKYRNIFLGRFEVKEDAIIARQNAQTKFWSI